MNFLPIPGGSAWSNLEYLIFIAGILFCFFEVFERLILIIIGKIEGRIVDPDSFFDAEFSLEEHPFEWIGVYGCHEPTRLISTDRDESDIESFTVFLSDFFGEWTISSISSKVEGSSAYLYAKSSPECLISIGESASREVLSRKVDGFDGGFLFLVSGIFCYSSYFFFPPVHIDDILDSTFFEVRLIPETSVDDRGITLIEILESRYIHVIIVIV